MSNERKLEELAYGEDWELKNLSRLITSVASVQRKVEELVATLPDQWQGEAATIATERLKTHQENLKKFRNLLNEAKAMITGSSETSCSMEFANQVRKSEAERLLKGLPGGIVPPWVHDAFNKGKPVRVFNTKIDVNAGLENIANLFGAKREEAAGRALETMASIILSERQKLEILNLTYAPLPVSNGGVEQIPPVEMPRMADSDFSYAGGASSGGAFSGSMPARASFGPLPDAPVAAGLNSPGTVPVSRGIVDIPEPSVNPVTPSVVDPATSTGYQPSPNTSGGNGFEGRGPSVDSRLDGSTVRTDSGAAGAGSAGLAAGAKLAGGAAGAGGLAGAGAAGLGLAAGVPAAAGAPGGARLGGSTSSGAGGSGGSAGGSGQSAGTGRGMRPGGMMMGGAGGGAAEDKKSTTGLGGYIAPKLEDEDEAGPASRASRSGSRDGTE